MAEAGTRNCTDKAWGCSDCRNWVPYPKHHARRNPIVDAVKIIDDPCQPRPAYNKINFAPEPKFRNSPREGYPNAMCNLEDYAQEASEDKSGQAGTEVHITVAPGTPQQICLKAEPILQTDTIYANPPTIEDCCKDARSLDTLKAEVKKVVGPHEELELGMKPWAECQSSCQPLLRKYPCRGVIRSPREDWIKISRGNKCKPTLASMLKDGPDAEYKPLTGHEFTEGMKTCDIYPIDPKLPKRFNNAEWFKGYGCETQVHPFYLTTSKDYGRFPPTAHTMTQCFYPKESKFTESVAKAGMPRNRSLNLASDKTII